MKVRIIICMLNGSDNYFKYHNAIFEINKDNEIFEAGNIRKVLLKLGIINKI